MEVYAKEAILELEFEKRKSTKVKLVN